MCNSPRVGKDAMRDVGIPALLGRAVVELHCQRARGSPELAGTGPGTPPLRIRQRCLLSQVVLYFCRWCQPINQNLGGSVDGCTVEVKPPVTYFTKLLFIFYYLLYYYYSIIIILLNYYLLLFILLKL